MLNLIITIVIIIKIDSILSLNSADLCYSIKDSDCKRNYSYNCGKSMCSLNKETCKQYKRHKRSFIFRSLKPLIQFHKEIKKCDFNETIDLDNNNNKYCLNRHDCLEANILVVYGIVLKNELKKIDCKCKINFKYECNRDYCTNDLDSCKMIQKLEKNNIKNCDNKKTYSVIHRITKSHR